MMEILSDIPSLLRLYILKKGEFKNMKGVAILTFNDGEIMITTKEHLEREAILFTPITSITFLDHEHMQLYVINKKHYFKRDPDMYLGPIGEYKLTQTISGERRTKEMILSWVKDDLAHIIAPVEKKK